MLDAVPAGLRGVVVTDTSVGDVRGEEGRYHYRQYDAVELAERRSFEDVWYLLLHGHLPTDTEAAAFAAEIRRRRVVPDGLRAQLPAIAAGGGPLLDQLRSALSLAGAVRGCRPLLDLSPEQRRADVVALGALVPVLVAQLWRAGQGLPLTNPLSDATSDATVPADGHDGHAAHYLRLARGEPASAEEVRALERYLVATIDHGFNASTFTARVVASTGADAAACLVAALGALSGPLHGGAPSRALELVEEVMDAGGPEYAGAIVERHLARGDKLMGFGHAVYRGDDPRSALLRRTARELGGPRVADTEAVEAALVAALDRLKPDRQIRPNVELYAGVVMERCGLPAELFTPTFAVSRVVGWGTHVLEQAAEGRLIRPSAHYAGPWPLEPVPLLPTKAA